MGRTTRRKSSTCSETTNSESASRRFGSEESEVGRCVRNRKSSAESVVGIRNPEVRGRIRNDRGEDRRMTAQEVVVHSESANSSSEEKSEIIGKARKFEMPIPPLRVDVPSSSARFQPLRGYWGLTRSFRPKSQRDRQVKGEKLGEPETRQQERRGAAAGVQRDWWSIQACKGPKEPRLPTRFRKSRSISRTRAGRRLERPKRMRECSEEFRWPERPKRNMTGRNRRTERVREAKMDDGECRRGGRGGKGNEAKTPKSAQRNKKSIEDLGNEKVNRKEQSNFQLRAAARSRNALNRRRPDLSSEHENGKETANGGEQPRTTPDASAEASIGRSEMPMAGAEATRNAEMKYVGRERVPEQKAKMNECRRGMDVGDRKQLGGTDQESRVRNGSESSERKETREEQRAEVATGSTGGANPEAGGRPSKAPKVWWSLGRCRPEGVTEVRRIRTKVESWNSSEERRGMVKQSSEMMQQICSNHIPTEIFGDIRICGGFKARCSEPKPSQDREFQEEFAKRARGVATENSGAADRKPEETSAEGMTEVRKMRTKCQEVERFGNKDRRVGQSDGAMEQGRSDHIPTEIFGDIRICGGPKAITQPANCSSTREMSGTEGTETECSEGNFAKSCEGNRRRAPKIAGGANRGLEGSTERDVRLSGASETQGRKVTEIRESRRKVGSTEKGSGLLIEEPGPGEDVWDFGKDVRDPERPESFSGASLGNRKSQNTIRTSVRGELTGRYRVKAERQRKGSGTSRSDRINRKVQVEAQGRRRGRSGCGGQAERNRANPMVRNELQKSEGRGEEPRDSGDKMPEVSETTEMEERKCRGIRDPNSVPENKSG
ncbi:hypothetical protein DFH06DRAFT_1153258 [Mycena polygramma]|nr:hypothetical protein DFH06DRAFT_1153258 [Mycena polygramma]